MTMRNGRVYPCDPVDTFPEPPTTFEDGDGREIAVRSLEEAEVEQVDALVEMYVRFDPEDRAQGIPPTGERRIREWLGPILESSVNVVAWHGDDVVGHATLVPDVADGETVEDYGNAEWELAIFVLQEYQQAGIGTELLEHLLGYAGGLGIERVWLTVERWNGPAISLYKSVGFELCGAESFEQEMSIRLG